MTEEQQVDADTTDAVTTPNVKVLAETPARAMAQLYEATASAQANLKFNAVNAQQQQAVMAQAATTMAVSVLLSDGTADDTHLTAMVAQSSEAKKD